MHVTHEEHDHGPVLPHSHASAGGAPVPLPVQGNVPGQFALLTAPMVHHQVFTVVRLRSGYDLAEVDTFLAHVETTLSLLWQDNARLRERLSTPPTGVGGETIAAARREARRIVAAAHEDAERLRGEAAAAADALAQAARLAIGERLDGVIADHGRHLHDTLRALLDDIVAPPPGETAAVRAHDDPAEPD
ncbi:DivIVA domain-containing protein [Nonomuraea angiospora]|uniref:Cell wall synthesis protein Wag31 n=1 Tax=Nonomuraea angiospora TaxID=46172 RepID=A0ABR9LTA3_9ACTN|nr:DivIVA domain-containing protein [Nonomuraea angiospora]MBE1583605.1 DivIVA domain-containing protein [Nonomuraea angiospora]